MGVADENVSLIAVAVATDRLGDLSVLLAEPDNLGIAHHLATMALKAADESVDY